MYSILLTLIIILNIISAQRDTRTAFQATSRRRMLCSIVEAASNAAFPDCSTNLYGKNITNLSEGASPKGFSPKNGQKTSQFRYLWCFQALAVRSVSGACPLSSTTKPLKPLRVRGFVFSFIFRAQYIPIQHSAAEEQVIPGPLRHFFRKKLYFCPNSGKSG